MAVGKGGWLSAFKYIFRSNSRESRKSDDENSQLQQKGIKPVQQERKHSKKWRFSKPQRRLAIQTSSPTIVNSANDKPTGQETKLNQKRNADEVLDQKQKTLALAAATAATAEAAMAAANAAAEVVRLTRAGSMTACCLSSRWQEHLAAIKIQTAFRGYLARRILRELRGRARVEDLINSSRAQMQATKTFQSMQELLKIQAYVCNSRSARASKHAEEAAVQLQQKRRMMRMMQTHKNNSPDDRSQRSSAQPPEEEVTFCPVPDIARKRKEALNFIPWSQQPFSFRGQQPSLDDGKCVVAYDDQTHWISNWLSKWLLSQPTRFSATDAIDDPVLQHRSIPAGRNARRSVDMLSPAPIKIRSNAASSTSSTVPTMPNTMDRISYMHEGHHKNSTTKAGIQKNHQRTRERSPKKKTTTAQKSRTTVFSTIQDDYAADAESEMPSIYSINRNSLLYSKETQQQIARSRRNSTGGGSSSSIRDDESLVSSPSMPSYMSATESARAKARSLSNPKQRASPKMYAEHALSSPATRRRLSFPHP